MSDQNRKSHPRAAAVAAVVAGICVVLGFAQAPAFFFLAAWIGLGAVILLSGADHREKSSQPIIGSGCSIQDRSAMPGAVDMASISLYGDPLSNNK